MFYYCIRYHDFIVNIYTIGLGTRFYNLLVPLHGHVYVRGVPMLSLSLRLDFVTGLSV